MWIRQVILGIVGLSSGFAVAGGMFAFLIALGVVSRLPGRLTRQNISCIMRTPQQLVVFGESGKYLCIPGTGWDGGRGVLWAVLRHLYRCLGHGFDGNRGCSPHLQQKDPAEDRPALDHPVHGAGKNGRGAGLCVFRILILIRKAVQIPGVSCAGHPSAGYSGCHPVSFG